MPELETYLTKILADGSSAIILATTAHHQSLAERIQRAGTDLNGVRREGRYIALDAADILCEFMVRGRPDPLRFSGATGRLIARAAAASRDENHRVVVFEEIAALLLAEKNPEAAVAVDNLWTDLAATYASSLHSAHAARAFRRDESLNSSAKTYQQHSAGVAVEAPSPLAPPDNGFPNDLGLRWHEFSSPEIEWHRRTEPFHLFIDSVQDYAIFMLDPEGKITTWNAGAERAKGYKSSEIIGQHFSRFYPEEDIRSGKPARFLAAAAKEGRAEDEGWRVRKGGSKFWASVTLTSIRDSAGTLMGFGKVTRDLTERRNAELALRHSEERSRLFIEAVKDYAIFMLDPHGYVNTWNAGAEKINGYKAWEIIGQHFSRFYPEDALKIGKPNQELEIATREGRFEEEGWRIRKDGSRFWASVVITPVHDGAGRLIGFSKVTRDVTERMLAGTALEESRAKLQESEKSLRELSLHLLRTQDEERRLIGREMHDSLGQFLSVLKMKLDGMSARAASNPTSVKQQVDECAMLVEQCVKEVRTVSYLLYPPMLEEMGLKSAIPWYVEGFSKRSGIKITSEIPADFERMPRDSELVLFRVLQESLTNVHKHSGSAAAQIRLQHADDTIILEVSDQGKGLPSRLIAESGPDWMGSLGVGLRGMSERLRQLGGALTVISNKEGTIVRASVPIGDFVPANTDS
jgi:PAS domain S-box-containing protein